MPLVRSHVREALVSSLDPYAFCLHLLEATYRHGQGPQSLARVALTELHQCIQGMTGSSDVPFPKTFHKELAVKVGAYCNPTLFHSSSFISSMIRTAHQRLSMHLACGN